MLSRFKRLASLVALVFLLNATPTFAQCTSAPPGGNTQNCPSPQATPTPTPSTVQTLVQVFQQIIQFPAATVQAALENAFKAILQANIAPMRDSLEVAVGLAVFGNTPILGGGLVPATVFQQAWEQVRNLSFLLWPILLGVLALTLMTHTAVAAGFEVEDWWQLLLQYGVVVLAAATSIYWMDGLNNIAIELTRAILNMGGQPVLVSKFTEVLLGAALATFVAPAFSIIATALIIIAGFLILVALVLQFTARYALLFVFVAIAPMALLAELLPLTKWLSRLWLKGFVLTILLQPINALLFKFTAELLVTAANRGLSLGFIGTFLVAAGVLSLLVTLNFTVVKFVYGGIQEVLTRAANTVKGLVSLGGVLVTAVGLGAAGGGAVPPSATAAAGGGGSGGAATNTSLGNFNWNRALETAGSVLAQGTNNRFVGGIGAGLRAMGSSGLRHDAQARPAAAAPDDLSTRDQLNLFRQMASDIAPRGLLNATERESIAHGLFVTSQQHGVEAVKQAWSPVATSVRNTLEGGGSMRDMVEPSGYRNIPDFVQGQVSEAISAQGNTVSAPRQRYSDTPTYADYKIGTYMARQLGSTWREDAAAIGELYHYLRTQTKDGEQLVAQLIANGNALSADGQADALARFVRSTSEQLGQQQIRTNSDMLTAWRKLSARHLD